MINRKFVLAGLTIAILALCIGAETNLLIENGSLVENFIDRELEESIEEISESELFDLDFTNSGGDDILEQSSPPYVFQHFKTQSKSALSPTSKRCCKLSLTILYCCLKIAFC